MRLEHNTFFLSWWQKIHKEITYHTLCACMYVYVYNPLTSHRLGLSRTRQYSRIFFTTNYSLIIKLKLDGINKLEFYHDNDWWQMRITVAAWITPAAHQVWSSRVSWTQTHTHTQPHTQLCLVFTNNVNKSSPPLSLYTFFFTYCQPSLSTCLIEYSMPP